MRRPLIRALLPSVLAGLALAGGCHLAVGLDPLMKAEGGGGSGGQGGGGFGGGCDLAACNAMDEECLGFTCNAGNTGCDEGTPVAENEPCLITTDNICDAAGQCVPACDPATCDAMDQECLDFACLADTTGCDSGTPVAAGQPCLLTAVNVCDDMGGCGIPECVNGFQDGDETDVDCGGSSCSGCDNGLNCTQNSDCRSNNCGMNGTCDPCTDGGGHCSTTTVDTFCDDEHVDVAEHVCKPKLANGNGCDFAPHGHEQCLNGNCVDSICCNSACAATCEACNQTGLEGTCTSYPLGVDPDNECTGAKICDGAGACKEPDGSICSSSTECVSGFCVDGVCCDSACGGNCESCLAAATGAVDGACASITAGTDPDAECGNNCCNGAGMCDMSGGC